MGSFVAVVVLGIVLLLVGIARHNARRRMWQTVALRYGCTFLSRDLTDIPRCHHRFALFKRGHSRKAFNLVEGKYRNNSIKLFDYQYVISSGKHSTTHCLSALIAKLDIVCPYLHIRPEKFFDRIGDLLGFDDIDFEYEQFNRQFHVQGDKRFAYDICHTQMMDLLLNRKRLIWELYGDTMIVYGLGTFDEQEIAYCLDTVNRFLQQIPQYLKRG